MNKKIQALILGIMCLILTGAICIQIKTVNVTEWNGKTNVTFDGQYHSVFPNLGDMSLYLQITSITYTGLNETITYDLTNGETANIGAINADTYTVTCEFLENDNVTISQFETTLIINKKVNQYD